MTYHDANLSSKTSPRLSRVARITLFVLFIGVGALAFTYRDSLMSRLSVVLAASEDDPIPVMSVKREPFQLLVPAIGEIVDLESVPVPVPNTPSGTLRVAWLIPEGTYVEPGDTVVTFDSTDAKLSLEQQQNTLEANEERTDITSSRQETDKKVLNIDRTDAEKEYEYAMTVLPQDETIFSKWDIIEAQINAGLAKQRIDFLGNKSRVQQRIARSDMQILAIERNKAQAEISLIQQTLNSLALKSPAAGLAIYRRDRREDPQVGAETQPGQVLVEIVDLTTLQARIYVLERDAGNLQVGKEVLIHLDAIPDHVFNGTIKIVSATAQPLERNSPLRYFTCDVQVKDVTEYIRRIRPGMALKADVVIDKYDSCFVLPAGAVTFKDTENLVYVQKGDTFVARQVQTGLSSHGQTTVVEGLKEGETVALKNPFETRQLYLPDFSRAAASQQGGPRGRGGNRGAMMRMFIEQR